MSVKVETACAVCKQTFTFESDDVDFATKAMQLFDDQHARLHPTAEAPS